MRSALLFFWVSHICPRHPCEAGSHQAAICYRNTGIAPLRRSDRAAQCSDAFKAGVSLFLLTVIAVPVAIRHLQQVLPLASRSGRSSRTRLSWLTLSRLVRSNVLDEMLVQFSRYTEGGNSPLTIRTFGGRFYGSFRKIFSIFFLTALLRIQRQ